MNEPARRLAWITNNFLHDMATGTWAATLLVLLVLHDRFVTVPAEAAPALRDAGGAVFVLGLAALGVVALTGAARLLYWRKQTQPEDLQAKRRALIVKHAVFAVLYGGGTVWMWTLLQ